MKPGIEEVLARFGPALHRVAGSYERIPARREELTQEIALALFRSLPRLRDEKKLVPFVFRIAHNVGVNHVIMAERESKARDAAAQDRRQAPVTPEDAATRGDEAARLDNAIRALPTPYRQVMVLALEDLSYAEIAEALSISPSNVGVRIARAKVMLKNALTS